DFEEGLQANLKLLPYYNSLTVISAHGKNPFRKPDLTPEEEEEQDLPSVQDLGKAPPVLTPLSLGLAMSVHLTNWSRAVDSRTAKSQKIEPGSTFYLGKTNLGKVFLVFEDQTPARGNAPSDGSKKSTKVPELLGQQIMEHIQDLVKDEASFIPHSQAFANKKETKLDATRTVMFLDLILNAWPALKSKLGSWAEKRFIRTVLIDYGQNLQISSIAKSHDAEVTAIANHFGGFLDFKNIDDIELAIATHVSYAISSSLTASWLSTYILVQVRRTNSPTQDYAIMIDIEQATARALNPSKLSGYPLGGCYKQGNVWGPTSLAPIHNAVKEIQEQLDDYVAAPHYLVLKSIFTNFYNLSVKEFRPNPKDFLAQQGHYTAGLCTTPSILNEVDYKGAKLQAIKRSVKESLPRKQTLRGLQALQDGKGKCASRLEHTTHISLRDMPETLRNPQWLAANIFVPLRDLIPNNEDKIRPFLTITEKSNWPKVTQILVTKMYDELDAHASAISLNPSCLTIARKEVIAFLERLICYLLTGSMKQIPTQAWKHAGTVRALAKTGFPYVNAAVLNFITCEIAASRYAPSTENSTFGHTAAISYNFGPAAGEAALALARLELAILKTVGDSFIRRNPMDPYAMKASDLDPHVGHLLSQYFGGLRKSAHRILSREATTIVKKAAGHFRDARFHKCDLSRCEDQLCALDDAKLKAMQALDTWVGLYPVFESFQSKHLKLVEKAFVDLNEMLYFAQDKTAPIDFLLKKDEKAWYIYTSLASIWVAALYPKDKVPIENGVFTQFPKIEPSTPTSKVGQVIGAVYGLGATPHTSNLSPHDLIGTVGKVLEEEGVDAFPEIIANQHGTSFSFKTFLKVRRFSPLLTITIDSEDEMDEDDDASDDDDDTRNEVARSLNPNTKKRYTNDQLLVFRAAVGVEETANTIQVNEAWAKMTSTYTEGIENWAVKASTANNSKAAISVKKQKYLLEKVRPLTKDLHRYIVLMTLLMTAHPTNKFPILTDLPITASSCSTLFLSVFFNILILYILLVQQGPLPLTPGSVKYEMHNHRPRYAIVSILSSMATYYFMTPGRQNIVTQDVNLADIVSMNTGRKLGLHYLQLMQLGTASCKKPQWPPAGLGKFTLEQEETIIERGQALERAFLRRDFRSLFDWAYSPAETAAIVSFYFPNY
ncbi:hypothetical protein JCM5353_002092, partial [Sporobolomyces roseus]